MQKTLPKGWKWVKIGEVCETITGGTPLKEKNEYFKNGTIPWLRSSELTQGAIYKSELFITELGLKNSSAKILPQNSVLVAMYGATAGQVGILRFESAVNQAICGILPNKTFMPEFLYWFLSANTKELKLLCAGGTQQNLSQTIIKNLKVILPPLPTQHKIVEILEEADNLRKLRQQADEKMKDLIPSLFVQMFGDPATNPKGWGVKKLGEVTGIVSGSTPRTNVPEYWNGDILWITPADLSNLATIEINDSERKITKEGYASCSTTILPIGTVLLSSRAPIGHLAIAGKAMCTNQGFKSLIPQTSVHSYYLYFALRYFKERLISLGSGATFKEISKSSVEKFEIPIPPLPLQQEFATLVEDIEAEKARQAESRKKLDELFNSLMQGAFTGELVAWHGIQYT